MAPDGMIIYLPITTNPAPAILVDLSFAVVPSTIHPAPIASVLHRST